MLTGWVQCADGIQCLRPWYACDGVDHCGDGSDEIKELCGEKLEYEHPHVHFGMEVRQRLSNKLELVGFSLFIFRRAQPREKLILDTACMYMKVSEFEQPTKSGHQ